MHNALNTTLKVMTVLISLLSFTLAGNESNTTRTVAVKATLSTSELQGLSLKSNASTVNVGETIQLSVVGTYSDGSSNAVDENITYTIIPTENAEMNGSVLTAKKDGNVTVQATVGGVKSNSITLSITGRTNSYVLLPEPDPAVNNATLLGVDVNDNGVRDDVERNIYTTYPVKLQRELLMYGAVAMQESITKPLSEAQEIAKKGTKATDCMLYLMDIDPEIDSDEFNEVTFLENKTANTKERIRKYLDYNIALSGGVYGSGPKDWNREACSPEIVMALEEMGK